MALFKTPHVFTQRYNSICIKCNSEKMSEKIEKYDREFLLKFQASATSKPVDLPDLCVTLQKPTHLHHSLIKAMNT